MKSMVAEGLNGELCHLQNSSMAAMASNTKISLHSRSKSDPSVPHPLILQFHENLKTLKPSEPPPSSSSSSSSICQNLNGLHDLHDCIYKLLQLLTIQQELARECSENCVDELLEGSIRLLDISSSAEEALLESKESIKELQSVIRRRRKRGREVAVSVDEFASSRKKAKKAIHKTLENLKGNQKGLIEHDHGSVFMVRSLKEAEVIALSLLQSLLSFMYGSNSIGKSKHNIWSMVFKFTQPKRVACDSERSNTNEFEKLDTTLESLLCHHKPMSVVSVENFLSHLENLELCIGDLEKGIEHLQRGLIRIRVSLLNIFNH